MSPRESIVRELSLEELLLDPVVRLVMRRDGVRERDIRALAERAAEGRV
ncbi:MAG: hypothetical protein RH982_17445 [Parvibaculum sp.]